MTELKPCPFCAGEASADGHVRYSSQMDMWWDDDSPVTEAFFVNCMKCGFRGSGIVGGFQTRDLAVAYWNTRPLESVNADLLEALTKIRKGLDLVDPARPLQYADAMDLMRKCADAAISLAEKSNG